MDAVGQGPNGTDYTYADKPVQYVSWFNTVRFTNWMQNGQGSGDTETGAYTLEGGTGIPSNWDSITRNSDAAYWLPSEDEWVKAAYYDPDKPGGAGYYNYATGNDTQPDFNNPPSDTGNSANWGGAPPLAFQLTDVGAYSLSVSPYGTYDQDGNVAEWTDSCFGNPGDSTCIFRGGSWGDLNIGIERRDAPSDLRDRRRFNVGLNLGFRVATVPEPSTLLLGALATVGLLLRRRRLS